LRQGDATATDARARANQETVKSEVDIIRLELEAKNYATAAKLTDRMVSFIQTTLNQKKEEKVKKDLGDGRR
jgi:hypothetical protein